MRKIFVAIVLSLCASVTLGQSDYCGQNGEICKFNIYGYYYISIINVRLAGLNIIRVANISYIDVNSIHAGVYWTAFAYSFYCN